MTRRAREVVGSYENDVMTLTIAACGARAASSPATSAARVVGVDSPALFNRVPTASQ
jgi:hypothetical protein